VREIRKRDATVRALVRGKDRPAPAPGGVELVEGDLRDPISIEKALDGIDKLCLLKAVVPDKLTRDRIAYGLANKRKMRQIMYHSVFKVDDFKDVSHCASKFAIESALREFDSAFHDQPPNYFFQNNGSLKEPLTEAGIYPMPVGLRGISVVDIRDIAESAAIALTSDGRLGKTYNRNGPNVLGGPGIAEIWSGILVAESDDIEILTKLPGHKPGGFAGFAQKTAQSWQGALRNAA